MTDQQSRTATFTQCIASLVARAQKTLAPGDEWAAQKKREQESAERRRRLHALQRLELPLDAASCAGLLHDSLDSTPATVAVADWLAKRESVVLVLHGPSGSGKTVAAAHAALHRQGSEWVTASDLVAPYTALYGEDSAEWQRYRRAPLLVIDRLEWLAREKTRAVLMEALTVLLDQRKRRDTIITTRLSLSLLESAHELEPLKEQLANAEHHTVLALPGKPKQPPPPTPKGAR